MRNSLAIMLVVILIGGGIVGCQPKETPVELPVEQTVDTKSYYYPVEELATPQIYEYSAVVSETEAYISHYWKIQKEVDEEGKVYLVWERYNTAFQKDMYTKEWIVADGVVSQVYDFYTFDSTNQTFERHPNKIKQSIVYPFKPSTDSVMAYRYECEMKLPPDFTTVKLIRDRQFDEFVTVDYKGEELQAAVFISKDFYDIEDKEKGGFWNQEKNKTEVYAEGIGLIYEDEQIKGEEGIAVTQLTNIYTVEEFEKLKTGL